MIELFAEGINTKFNTPMRGCRVFATEQSMVHDAGEFLGTVSKVDGNKIHVDNKGETDIYLWRFPKGDKNHWIEFSA